MTTDICKTCFLKNAMEGIWLLDESGNTTFVNNSIAELLGLSAQKIQNQPIFAFMDRESQTKIIDNLELCRQGMKLQQEVKFFCQDGSDLWAIVSTNPIFNQSGKYTGALLIVTDISQRKSVEEDLRQEIKNLAEANLTKDRFLAIVAHELRTPLTAIQGWTDVLLSRKLDESTTVRALKTIRQNAQLQNQLIEDLLDLSRMMRGKLSLNFGPINLIASISSAIETVRPTAQAKGIEIESVIDLSVGKVLADSDRLQQVLWNLLSNAIKFTPEAGKVEIHLEKVGAEVKIQVKDTGIGINPDFLPHVFDAFRQGDNLSIRENSGLGLGLAIARQVVELHNGTICATSEGEGKGATFTVQLPIAVNGCKPLQKTNLPPLELTDKNEVIESNSLPHQSQENKSCAVTGIELLTSYVAYYISRGKAVISPLNGPILFEGSVYQYNGYHINFLSFWKQLQQLSGFLQLYIEGDVCCFGDFIDERYTISECARCNLPVPTVEGHAYDVPICTLCESCIRDCRANDTPESNAFEDEFVITRVLAIGKTPDELKVGKNLFSANGFIVNFVANPEEITPDLLRLGVDMVLIDAEISEADAKVWEQKLHRYPQLMDIPIIALTPEAGHSLPWLERTLGVEDYLLAPLGGNLLAHHLHQIYQPTHNSCRSSLHWFPR